MNKYLVLPNINDLTKFKAKGFNSFILPLNNYSIGFDVYFDMNIINELSNENNIYVMINKFFHKRDLIEFKKIINELNIDKIKGIFIEDLGLLSVFPKEKVIIYQNHIINNYESINYFNSLGYKNIVINNALTINEIKDIRKNAESDLYYFLISKDILMYSKRSLVSNYFKHYNLNQDKSKYLVKEEISKKELIVSEEKNSTTISNNDIFCANKYIKEIEYLNYLIINLTNISEEEVNIILDNYNSDKLFELVKCDYYFLENDIKYKVGDL